MERALHLALSWLRGLGLGNRLFVLLKRLRESMLRVAFLLDNKEVIVVGRSGIKCRLQRGNTRRATYGYVTRQKTFAFVPWLSCSFVGILCLAPSL